MPSCIYDSSGDRCGERGADDAGEVAELRDSDLAARIELVDEQIGFLHDAAADHDQLGPEHRVQLGEVGVEPLGPLFPREVLLFALGVGGPGVGDLAVHLEVTELGVRDEHAVVEERGADRRCPTVTSTTTPRRLRAAPKRASAMPGRVGVVQHGALATGGTTDHGRRVRADPRLVDVCGGANRAAHHDRRKRAPDRAVATPSCSTSVGHVADTASGVAGWGVTSRIRPVAVPVLMSTSAALMPEPPTSTPMRLCVVDIASKLVPRRTVGGPCPG